MSDTWISSDGTKTKIKNLDYYHLRNIIRNIISGKYASNSKIIKEWHKRKKELSKEDIKELEKLEVIIDEMSTRKDKRTGKQLIMIHSQKKNTQFFKTLTAINAWREFLVAIQLQKPGYKSNKNIIETMVITQTQKNELLKHLVGTQ